MKRGMATWYADMMVDRQLRVRELAVFIGTDTTGLPIVPLTFSCSKKKSSRAGTASWSLGRSVEGCSSGERRSRCRLRPRKLSWKPSGLNLRKP